MRKSAAIFALSIGLLFAGKVAADNLSGYFSAGGKVNVIVTNPLTNTHLFVGSISNVATDVPLSGDGTLANTGAITVTKTGGVSFAPSATTDTTIATNITSGTLNAARLPNTAVTAGSYTNSSFTVDAAGRLTAASSGTDATNASNISSGTLNAARLPNTAVTAGSYTSTNLTVDAAGRITAASSGSGGTFLGWSGDMSKRTGWAQTLGSGTSYAFSQALGTNVANSYLELANRAGQQLTTGNASGNDARLQDAQSPSVFTIEQLPVITFSVTPVSTTNLRFWFGCFTPTAQDGDTLAASGVTGFGIRDSTTAGDTTYKFVTSDGAADTVVNTGVSIAANTPGVWVFDTSPGTKIDCYYNGSKVASSSTHLPPNTTALDWILRMFTEENVAKSYWFGRTYWEAL